MVLTIVVVIVSMLVVIVVVVGRTFDEGKMRVKIEGAKGDVCLLLNLRLL